MRSEDTLSSRLKQRRSRLGLSLAEVARRADTSPATLSRYENGWTRFETYTLKKLAMALGCDLAIDLRPVRSNRFRPGAEAVVAQLKRLFWDRPLTTRDLRQYKGWLVERVLEYGALRDIEILREFMGRRAFAETVASRVRLSPRTRSFWRQVLEKEGVACTKKSFRNTAWIS